MRKLFGIWSAAMLAAILLAPGIASAAPQNTRISDVYACPGASCSSESIQSGSVVNGDILVTVGSQAALGLEYLRLEARQQGTTAWTCMRQWSGRVGTGEPPQYATNMERDYRWDTLSWPEASGSGCPSSLAGDGSPTANGVYELRARAREVTSGSVQPANNDTVHFVVKVNNAASKPQWAASPSVFKDGQGRPIVELKWHAVAEPDVVEYHFFRQGPDGVLEYAVRASSPGQNGCTGPQAPKRGVITCWDNEFPSQGYGGQYRYTLVAYRSSTEVQSNCVYATKCRSGQVSSQENANVVEPSPSPSPSTSPPGSGSPTPRPSTGTGGGGGSGGSGSTPRVNRSPSRVLPNRVDNSEFYTGTYDQELPYEQGESYDFLPSPNSGGPVQPPTDQGTGNHELASAGDDFADPVDRRIIVSIAAGLLMVLAAMHIARLLYEQ